jgi:hypothetical protein
LRRYDDVHGVPHGGVVRNGSSDTEDLVVWMRSQD